MLTFQYSIISIFQWWMCLPASSCRVLCTCWKPCFHQRNLLYQPYNVHKNTINNIFYVYTHFPIISVLLLWWCNIFLLHKVLRCTLYGWYRRFLWWKQGFQQVHRTLQLLADKHIHHSNIEILEYWNIGILKCQNANMLICWKVKMLKC